MVPTTYPILDIAAFSESGLGCKKCPLVEGVADKEGNAGEFALLD